MQLLIFPNPVLNTPSAACRPGDRSLRRIARDMARLMYENNGCGIAAPQVGLNIALVVIDTEWDGDSNSDRNPIVLVNPKIEELQGKPRIEWESCLSCPGVSIPVTRHPWVRVSYFDLAGDEWEISGEDLLGRCLQHEIDHLLGRTLFDVCEPEVKMKAFAAYNEARLRGARPGETLIKVELDEEGEVDGDDDGVADGLDGALGEGPDNVLGDVLGGSLEGIGDIREIIEENSEIGGEGSGGTGETTNETVIDGSREISKSGSGNTGTGGSRGIPKSGSDEIGTSDIRGNPEGEGGQDER